MSAFLVSNNHINAIVWAAVKYKIRVIPITHDLHETSLKAQIEKDDSDVIGKKFLYENLLSLDARYPDDTDDKLNSDMLRSYHYEPPEREYSVIELFHIINCYEYQACEHDDFENSWIKHFCLMLKETLIRQLPDYQKCEIWAV